MSLDSDAKFERALLASARADPEPGDVHGAWARFAASVASTRVVADDGRGASVDAMGRSPVAPAAHGAHAAAITWLLLGALGGAASVAGVVALRRPEAPHSAPPAMPTAFVKGPEAPPDQPVAAVAPSHPAGKATPSTRSSKPPRRHSASVDLSGSHAFDDEPTSTEGLSRSTLSEEVSRLDRARAASARGDCLEALRLVEGYHRDFPSGLLRADADVVALEAAAAEHDQPEVERRAALFIARYPNDPHTARVRALLAQSRSDVRR